MMENDGFVEARPTTYAEALALQEQGADEAAVAAFHAAIAADSAFAPAWYGLACSLYRLRRLREALEACDRSLALAEQLAAAHALRGVILLETKRILEALPNLQRAADLLPESVTMWCNLGFALAELGRLGESEAAYRRALALAPGDINANLQLAETLTAAHRLDEARQYQIVAAKADRVRLEPCRGGKPDGRVLILLGAGQCNLPTNELIEAQRFEKLKVTLLPPDAADGIQATLAERLLPFDLVFNAIADADRGKPFFATAAAFCDRLGTAVLNPPARIEPTSRDLLPALLEGIPDFIAPRCRRASSAELRALAAAPLERPLKRPLLIRPLGAHGGVDLDKVETAAELTAFLDRVPLDGFYVTDYWDYRSADGFFRKYRFIFVDRQVFAYHLAIGSDWKVHYWRVDMNAAARLKAEEETFLADYRTAFPGALGDAVREVARRMDLDYAGMDCGITPDGKVLLFEANATMLIHRSDSMDDFAYKRPYLAPVFDAVTAMITNRLTPDS